jgi:alkanesulfonate monooxygenase SsuD/methylene tetrahydromethanopterin reductase-like flavin-dependent oxidoreductase (luciferase family)
MRIHGDRLRFGVHSGQQYTEFEDCLELWQRAEALGYDWASVFDHFRPPLGGPGGPCFEGTTLLAALAARTSTIRCGMLVLAAPQRHPAVTAAIAATIDHISGGRLELGLGAGGADLAHQQYGLPHPSAEERMDLLDETCRVLRGLWTQQSTTLSGRHFRLDDAHLSPKPRQARLPLVIGGSGERRTLRIVAEHADIWNSLPGDPVRYKNKLDVLAEHCASVGRDPSEIRPSITFRAVLGADRREARERERELRARIPRDSELFAEYLAFGTPDQCVEQLLPYVRLGVGDFLLGVRPPVDYRTVELFAQHVVPALRAA